MKHVTLSHTQVDGFALQLARRITQLEAVHKRFGPYTARVYPVPRGGIPVAYLLRSHLSMQVVDDPAMADVIIDDIVASGATKERYQKALPLTPFMALIEEPTPETWYVFPWEGDSAGSSEDIFVRLLQFVGEDPKRGGLLETPKRMAKAWQFWCSGYGQDPKTILKTFADGGEKYDGMLWVKDIPFFSQCEHHLAPFFGVCSVAYIPDKRIVGLSKFARLVDVFARRLQVQERLTTQIAGAIQDILQPKGVGVWMQARHMCMESRGVCKQGSSTTTSCLLGAMRDEPETRAEFIAGVNQK
jgi:GTP cyclohydrolase I